MQYDVYHKDDDMDNIYYPENVLIHIFVWWSFDLSIPNINAQNIVWCSTLSLWLTIH